jgi:hypothetical protein
MTLPGPTSRDEVTKTFSKVQYQDRSQKIARSELKRSTVRLEHPRAWLLAVVRNAAYTWLAKNRPSAVVLVDRRAQRGDADEPGDHVPVAGDPVHRLRESRGLASIVQVGFCDQVATCIQ